MGSLSLIGLSLVLFAVSLALPAYRYGTSGAPTEQAAGWSVFLSGWIPACLDLLLLVRGKFEFMTSISWFANPLLLGCWLVAVDGPRRMGVALGAAALGLSLVFLACHDISMPDNHQTNIVPGLGYAAWIASIMTAILGALLAPEVGSGSSQEPVDASSDVSRANAVREALRQFRDGTGLRIKCPTCRSRLTARRTLSASGAVPDIEILCPCGACAGKHPF